MSVQYTGLARFYDLLQADVDYKKWADYIERLIERYAPTKDIVLDLACGTGSLSKELWERDYDLICVDNAPEMLEIAKEKYKGGGKPPLFLCQDMVELDLFGTIDVAICCLDSVNYLTYLSDLKQAFGRVSLFLNPGGIFIFDIKTVGAFADLKGQTNVVSGADNFFFWQYDYDKKSGICQHNVEMFEQAGALYKRYEETHFQRAYSFKQIEKTLKSTGFTDVVKLTPFTLKKATTEQGRVFFIARKA